MSATTTVDVAAMLSLIILLVSTVDWLLGLTP